MRFPSLFMPYFAGLALAIPTPALKAEPASGLAKRVSVFPNYYCSGAVLIRYIKQTLDPVRIGLSNSYHKTMNKAPYEFDC